MITNFKQRTKKDDIKLVVWLIVGFLLVVWFCTPPGNKFLQVCFWGNNTQMFIAKLKHEDTNEYIFHRNNAVYLAKMFPKDNKKAIVEMDKAIATLPNYAKEEELLTLYRERAQIHMFLGNYKQALNDYARIKNPGFNDYLRIAMLYKIAGNYRVALSYCNSILSIDNTAFAGFACLADIYDTVGYTESAIRVWDLAFDRRKNLPRGYLSRALLKKKIGDMKGYEEDLAKAREYSPSIRLDDSIINDTIHPKILSLTIR